MVAEVKKFKTTDTVSVDPRKQYVSGGSMGAQIGGSRTLSGLPEDITTEHSALTYTRMMADPKISKAINLLKISIVGENVEIRPSLSEHDANYESAETIATFCRVALKHLDRPLRQTLEQMLDALIYGHKIAEVTYKLTELNGFNGLFLVPEYIKVKKLDVVQFVVDDKLNIIGFTTNHPASQTKRKGVKVTRGAYNEALIDNKKILPRDKFMVLTIRSKDEDPRGHSILAAAFHAWHLKVQILPEYLRYLLLCAIPLLVGSTPENESPIKELLRKPDGTPVTDANGNFVEANPVEALRDAMLQARNGEVLAVRGGTKVSEIGAQGAGTPFFKGIEMFDSQMETAVLLQTLATSEGLHQNRAASTMHMSVLDQLIYWFKGIVIDMLISDLLRPMIRYNFGDDALEFMPKISLGDTERREFAVDATAIAALKKAGYFTPEQLRQTDEILGFEPRDSVNPEDLIQRLQAAGVPIVAIPPQPQIAAEIQAGPDGGTTPVPITTPRTTEGGAKDGNVPSLAARGVIGRLQNAKLPAIGRSVGRMNGSPKNSQIRDDVTKL